MGSLCVLVWVEVCVRARSHCEEIVDCDPTRKLQL